MFGLHNFAGSCWVNACLQGIFRIPEVIERYTNRTHDTENAVDSSLSIIWNSGGKDGLKDFFEAARTTTMPSGQGIGDSNEMLVYLCDKLPYLDVLFRFKIAEQIKCPCGFVQAREDTEIEFELHPSARMTPIANCIASAVTPEIVDDWLCDVCKTKQKITKQKLIGSFPKAIAFRVTSAGTSIQYSSVLVLNSKRYSLLSVISHTGGHWLTHAREMPPGKPWFTLDDTRVRQHGANEFPMSEMSKLLIYYRLDE